MWIHFFVLFNAKRAYKYIKTDKGYERKTNLSAQTLYFSYLFIPLETQCFMELVSHVLNLDVRVSASKWRQVVTVFSVVFASFSLVFVSSCHFSFSHVHSLFNLVKFQVSKSLSV